MKTFFPDYYPKFKCIAEKCTNNCCIGWEIDIDIDTIEKYLSYDGPLKNKFKNNVNYKEKCFKLFDNDRCPFLNNNNLCEIIMHHGEEMLCEICKNHPRFINYFDDRIEIGLGLCCESAASLILSQKEKFSLNNLSDTQFFKTRQKIIEILQNREKTIDERIDNLLSFCSAHSPVDFDVNWKTVFVNLERLDNTWNEYLDRIDNNSFITKHSAKLNIPYEQLLIYFIYRHLSDALYDGMFIQRISFAILSFYVIRQINKDNSFKNLVNIARMYSSEIEYSDQNISIILDYL